MRYHIGDIVEFLGEKHIISKEGGKDELGYSYELRSLVTGYTTAWWYPSQFKYIERADDYLFELLDDMMEEIKKEMTHNGEKTC